MIKLGKNIKVGDKLTLESGQIVKVISIQKGITSRHNHVSLDNGDWAEIGIKDKVEISQ